MGGLSGRQLFTVAIVAILIGAYAGGITRRLPGAGA